MNCICGNTSAGLVTSRPLVGTDYFASAPVCALPACVDEALAWVRRVTFGKPAHLVMDGEKP